MGKRKKDIIKVTKLEGFIIKYLSNFSLIIFIIKNQLVFLVESFDSVLK